MDKFSLSTYDGTYLGSTHGTIDGNFEVLLLGDSLGSLNGIQLGCNEGNGICIADGIVIDTTLGTYDGTYLQFSQCSSNVD